MAIIIIIIISGHRSAAGRAQDGKFASQTPTLYHCATPPTNACSIDTNLTNEVVWSCIGLDRDDRENG